MLKRKATTFIKNWLDTKDKKCLVVQGARQTGKTYIIERFAEENFEELLEINFKQMPSAMDIFAGDLTVDNMIMAMRFRFPEKKIVPGKTLIFWMKFRNVRKRSHRSSSGQQTTDMMSLPRDHFWESTINEHLPIL
mgnify:CR=1 FL=1